MADLKSVATPEELAGLQRAVQEVAVEETVADYALRLVHATRGHPSIRLGVSMRGAIHLSHVAQARALLRGRSYVLPEDLKALAVPVLAHRLVLDTRAKYAGTDRRELVRELVSGVPLPR